MFFLTAIRIIVGIFAIFGFFAVLDSSTHNDAKIRAKLQERLNDPNWPSKDRYTALYAGLLYAYLAYTILRPLFA